jgi:murein DD-endopeptidase MepM/ murein hydrolase activator NlpD
MEYNEQEKLDVTKKIMKRKHRWKFPISKKNLVRGASVVLLSALVSSLAGNVYFAVENKKLFKEKSAYQESTIILDGDLKNLKILNEQAISAVQEKLNVLEQRVPVKGFFSPLERLVGGLTMFNYNPIYTQRLDEIVQESKGYSENPKELWEDWQIRAHGIKNYIPKIPWLLPPMIGDNKNTVVQQDMGKSTYIMIIGEDKHEGIDLTNKDSFKLYSSFDGFVVEDEISSGKGRTLVLQANQKDEKGYFYRVAISHMMTNTKWFKGGQQIKTKDYLGEVGNTGFVSGRHAHVEFWRSRTGKPGTFKELFDAFENKTYADGENLVWFNVYNVPESVKELVRERVK